MLCAKSNRIRSVTALAACSALFVFAETYPALAQEPPTTIPAGGPPAVGDGIPFNSWILFPTLDLVSQYSNNYFLSPQAPISSWGFGISPKLTAEWSDGIHTTTIYGSVNGRVYPTENEINALDEEATLTQNYAPLRDLNFTLTTDYTHQTIASGLTSSIPNPVQSTATTLLPNGNTVLPNGTIVSPTGEFVGQTNPALVVNGISVVNPFDQYTASGSVQKIFGYGIATVGASLTKANYTEQSIDDFTAKTFTENLAFWLGSVFYAYSNGVYSLRSSAPPNPDSTIYRVVGGIGTRQVGLFSASAYIGHQGSEESGTAGGNVYGGMLTYYPTLAWTLVANIDETINVSSQVSPSALALVIPATTPLQIPLSASTQTTSTALHSTYQITPQWTTTESFGYTRVQFLGSPFWENAWIADATLRYDIWRDLSLIWEYQFSSIISNQPNTNADRNLVIMTASYRF
jgi:hypothetical protein